MDTTATPVATSNPSAADAGDPLAQATALAAAGDRLAAIRQLTEANRRHRIAGAEELLVKLRHDAFEDVDTTGGRASWPPEFADPFPDVKGRPPEVGPDELSPEVLGGAIVHHGCLLVRGLVRQPRLDQLVHDIDQAFDAVDRRADGAGVDETAPWFVPFTPNPPYKLGFGRKWVLDGGGVWSVDSPRSLFDLIEAFDEVGIGEVIAGYLGEWPALSVKKSTLRRVPVESGTDWHQDGSFLGSGSIRTVNVWLSLSACGTEAASLDVVPRRLDRVVETGTHGAQFDWSVGPGMVDQVAEDTPVVRLSFEPGDALLFDDLFLHRTGVSPGMTKTRYAIESWFFAPSAYPHAQIPVAF